MRNPRPKKPFQATGEVVVFFTASGHFYPVQLSGMKSTKDEIPDHVALNPHTVRVQTIGGQTLWDRGALQ